MVLNSKQAPVQKKPYRAPAVRSEPCVLPNLFACTPANPIECPDGTCVKDFVQCG